MSGTVVEAARSSTTFVVRPNIAIVDVVGNDALDLLNRLSTNDLTQLQPRSGALTVLVTDKARIIDVLTVLRTNDGIRLIGSVGTAEHVIRWLRKYIIIDDARPRDCTNAFVCIDIDGPRSPDLLRELTGVDVSTLAMSHAVPAVVLDHALDIVRLPARCELRYRLVIPTESAVPLIEVLRGLETVPELDEATDQYLRVMSGMGVIGKEWTESYNPLEAGLLHMTSFSKGCYIGQEVIARLDSYNKVKQRLMGVVGGIELLEGDTVYNEGSPVGVVTSVTVGLDTRTHYGLAYIRREVALPDNVVACGSENGTTTAVLKQLPMEEA